MCATYDDEVDHVTLTTFYSAPVPVFALRITPFALLLVQLSIGDLAVVGRLNNFRNGAVAGTPTTIVDDYPLLISLIERVMAEPKIAAYMEALPEKK